MSFTASGNKLASFVKTNAKTLHSGMHRTRVIGTLRIAQASATDAVVEWHAQKGLELYCIFREQFLMRNVTGEVPFRNTTSCVFGKQNLSLENP